MDQLHFENRLHRLTAGLLPEDGSIELFGQLKTRKVFFLRNGKTSYFAQLPEKIKRKIEKRLLADKVAREDLSGMAWKDALEEYAFCLFGTADGEPDFFNGKRAQKTENFRCGDNCRCLKWVSKKLNYEGDPLTQREIQILDRLKTGDPDKRIADDLGIAMSTLDKQKKGLMLKLGAPNKANVVYRALKKRLID